MIVLYREKICHEDQARPLLTQIKLESREYKIFLGFKIKPYSPTVAEVDSVLDGKLIFIDWKSGLEPAIYVKYSTPSGDPLVSQETRVS